MLILSTPWNMSLYTSVITHLPCNCLFLWSIDLLAFGHDINFVLIKTFNTINHSIIKGIYKDMFFVCFRNRNANIIGTVPYAVRSSDTACKYIFMVNHHLKINFQMKYCYPCWILSMQLFSFSIQEWIH